MRPRIAILDGHFKTAFFSPLIEAMDADCRSVSAPSLLESSLAADLVLVNDETWPHHAVALPALQRQGIPTLHLMGGMLQWHHVNETPWPHPFLQPSLSSKIACLGAAQARTLEAWGNSGRCEVTGSHRFDRMIGRTRRTREGRWRLLITTGQVPHTHNADAHARTVRALTDVKQWLAQRPGVDAIWRLTGNLARELEVANALSTDLADQCASVDAVLSTPSTLMLEAMMLGLPVALLDYATCPHYVHPAWRIAAPSQVDEVLTSLEHPDAGRLQYQDQVLRDNLYCDTPATPRIVALMAHMIDQGRRSRADGVPLSLPPAMLAAPPHQPAPALPAGERLALETEIGHLRAMLQRRPSEIAYRALCELRRLIE